MILKRFFGIFFFSVFVSASAFAETAKQPITVNGDTVEFKAEGREVVAEGNVDILYQNTRLRCDKVRVFIDEKIALAEGRVLFEKEGGESMEGEMLIYDFGAGSGTIVKAEAYLHPYYARVGLMEKVSDTEILLTDANFSSCDLPHPHYGLHCREVKVDPGHELQAKGVKVSLGDIPIMYVPAYVQDLTDKRPRLMITPGYEKGYGMELFGAWRYYLNPNARGILHLDWYQEKGWAQGVDLNYDTRVIGKGNLKYYRIDEEQEDGDRKERSRVEVRHRWDMSAADTAILEYFRQSDVDFRKDYFEREYDKIASPPSYFLYAHAFPNAMFNFLAQPRVNVFDDVLQKIPEARFETVQQRVGQTSFYYKNTSVFSYLSDTTPYLSSTRDVLRSDMANQLSYVWRVAGLHVNPYVGHRDTYYRRGVVQESFLRGMFFSGVDLSTKFFRVYDVATQKAGLDIDKLRHIITPQIRYRYQHKPTVAAERLLQLDAVDTLDRRDAVTFALENKLQTKRDGVSADLGSLILSSDYNIERDATGGLGFQNFKYDLEFKPYTSWEFDSDAEFDTHNGFFRYLNSDLWGHFGRLKPHLGYRFKKDESSQITAGLRYQLNPFWFLHLYERFQFKTGDLVEQEYRLTRDMHCWLMELIIHQSEREGVSFLLGFTLKAFPDLGISAEKTFDPPRSS